MPHWPRKRTEQGPERRKEKEVVSLQPSWGVGEAAEKERGAAHRPKNCSGSKLDTAWLLSLEKIVSQDLLQLKIHRHVSSAAPV